jgi:hypothetical protein
MTITKAAIVIWRLVTVWKDRTEAAMAEMTITAPRLAGNLPFVIQYWLMKYLSSANTTE